MYLTTENIESGSITPLAVVCDLQESEATPTEPTCVITWQLKSIMKTERISIEDLRLELGSDKRTITRMRGVAMPKLNGDRVGEILVALNKLKRPESPLITPNDLMLFSLTVAESEAIESAKLEKLQSKKLKAELTKTEEQQEESP